jgi:hypothetical protein
VSFGAFGVKPSPSRFNRLDGVSFHGQSPTLSTIQQQSPLSELLQQSFNRCVLELDDRLLTLIDHATQCSEQNVPRLEQDGHVRRRKSPVSGADT